MVEPERCHILLEKVPVHSHCQDPEPGRSPQWFRYTWKLWDDEDDEEPYTSFKCDACWHHCGESSPKRFTQQLSLFTIAQRE
jgi:hypothetical protein